MEKTSYAMQNPLIGIAQTILTFAGGLTLMEITQGVISIVAGLLTICLLILQIRKALKK